MGITAPESKSMQFGTRRVTVEFAVSDVRRRSQSVGSSTA